MGGASCQTAGRPIAWMMVGARRLRACGGRAMEMRIDPFESRS